jgi:hypothetical protein
VDYTVQVTNTGNVGLGSVSVSYSDPTFPEGTGRCQIAGATLGAGAGAASSCSWTLSATRIVTATASAVPLLSASQGDWYAPPITSSATSRVFVPARRLGISLSGSATRGQVSTPYTFTATITPTGYALPVTYTWQATGQTERELTTLNVTSQSQAFTWNTPGTKFVTVTVSTGRARRTACQSIVISDALSLSPAEGAPGALESAAGLFTPVASAGGPWRGAMVLTGMACWDYEAPAAWRQDAGSPGA